MNYYELLGEPDVCLHMAWRDGFKHYSTAHIQDLPFHYSFLSHNRFKCSSQSYTEVSD